MPGPDTDRAFRRHAYRVARFADAARDVRMVWLQAAGRLAFPFKAGQFASVAFGGLAARDYSMANRPDQELLEFHIRTMSKDGTSAYVGRDLRPGEDVAVEGPFGESWLRRQHRGPILAIAGGSGLAPVKSIVETALALGMRQAIYLYFGVRDEPDLYLERHFNELARTHGNFHFIPVLSDPRTRTTRRAGLVGDAVAADFGDITGFKAYVAGPPPMVDAATAMLRGRGLGEEDLHADPFYSEAEMVERGRRRR